MNVLIVIDPLIFLAFMRNYGDSPQFLQPFSIDTADFPCRDPAISSSRSFYGQNICSIVLARTIAFEKNQLFYWLIPRFFLK